MSEKEFIIRKPDDWHLHLRDGEMLASVIKHSAANFERAIIMPNLVPPVVTTDDAIAYKERINQVIPPGMSFQPLMTLYLTEATKTSDIKQGVDLGVVTALKLYPAGATTNSENGVKEFGNVYSILEFMSEVDIPLLVHGEVTDPEIDIFDREAVFIERVLDPLRKRIPELRIVMEHITTKDAVDYVIQGGPNIAATVTTHHLIINRNAYLAGGIRPHYYCLPVAKRETHRMALRSAVCSGNEKFFLGTDSAPHLDGAKENACGCAGIYTSVNTLSCLAHVFEDEDALEKLEGFVSVHGPSFYKLPVNSGLLKFRKLSEPLSYPEKIRIRNDQVTVFDPGFPLFWSYETVDKGEV